MKITPLDIPDVILIEPMVFEDDRGFLFESFNLNKFKEITSLDVSFVQDNHSNSKQYVLRGLHYQTEHVQGKFVRVTQGRVYDVVVDIRRSSPTFGVWTGLELSAENHLQLWIPEGFAHGFVVLSEEAQFLYKTTDYWHAKSEQCIRWNDPTLKIDWQLPKSIEPLVNAKDSAGKSFEDAFYF